MDIHVEVDVYCADGKTEHATIILNEWDIARMAEDKAGEQYECRSVAARRMEVKGGAVNL